MLYVDSFGNIAPNLTRDDAERAGIVPGTRVELELAESATTPSWPEPSPTLRPGDVILYEDSYRNMSLAINRGNAASMLHATPGRPPGSACLPPACVALGRVNEERSSAVSRP